ncbi:MAG: Gfo/Idh/MocA family oxidoreductase [bacterium]
MLKVGIIGAGYMGGVHSRNLQKIDGVSIAAVCDTNLETAKQLNDQLNGNATVFTDWNNMYDDAGLDAVYVCLPPFAHNGEVETAAEKGIHTFLEKPIAISTSSAQSMVDAIKKAGTISQVGYHQRFGGAVKKLKAMLKDGTTGKPTLYTASFICNSLHTPWWRDINKSGGQVFEQIIHNYDMAIYFMGLPDKVSAFTANVSHQNIPGYTVEDTSVSSILFKSGGLGNIVGSNNAIPMQWISKFSVICEKVTADFTSANDAVFTYVDGEKTETEIISATEDPYFGETANFIAAIRGEEKAVTPVECGLKTIEFVSAVMNSSNTGGTVVSL